ncbi:site-specific integrase [Marinobacterium rhizophilum]|uniref:site-specific integrase n=1 Tax=Marinobacterium rhizophilum TaxID=420402 RepID=UPI00037C4A5C|nr:site-specific integrase [Marinobacterium rhizophilum]
MRSSVPYTYRRRDGTYYARFVLPQTLLTRFGETRRDIRFSLKTRNPATARCAVMRHAARFHQMVDRLKNATYTVYISMHKDVMEYVKSDKNQPSRKNTMALIAPLNRRHAQPQLSPVLPGQDLIKFHCDPAPRSKKQRKAPQIKTFDCPQAAQSPRNAFEIQVPQGPSIIINHNGDREAEWTDFLRATEHLGLNSPQTGSGTGGSGPGTSTGLSVREVVNEFIQSKITAEDWKDQNTQAHEVSRIEHMLSLLDVDRPFNQLTRADARALKKQLPALKDRRHGSTNSKPIAIQTAQKHFILFKAICRYAYIEEHHTIDIASGIDFKVPRKTANKRLDFTQSDVDKLLNGYHYRCTPLPRRRTLFDFHFWIPLIGLYSGARLNEICQLRICDIEQVQGIWCFAFRDEDSRQSIKNRSSIRHTPIHSFLLQLGFIDFLQSRQQEASASDQLFTGLNWDPKNRWGKKMSDWFNGNGKMVSYLDQCALHSRANKAFHSTRHTVVQNLRNQGVDEPHIAALVGHEVQSTTSRYGSGIGLAALQTVVNRINYGLNLSHLSFTAFCAYRDARGKPAQ